MTIQMLAKPEGKHVLQYLWTASCRSLSRKLTTGGHGPRRTGITLKEGKRDEHGMEDIEGMWSSPENSPTEKNDASIGSDGMSMDEGMCPLPFVAMKLMCCHSIAENAPGPADFLNSTKSARGPYQLPPVARSPIKTGLTGSPRRTPGLPSSQSPQRDIVSSSPSDGKGLGSAKDEPRQDISPLTNRSVNTPSFHQATSTRSKAKKAPAPARAVAFSDSDANSQFNGDENADVFEQIQNDFADGFDTSDNIVEGDQREPVSQDPLDLESQSVTPEMRPRSQAKTSISTRRNGRDEEWQTQGIPPRHLGENQEPSKKRKRPGRPPKSQLHTNPKAGMEEDRPPKKTKPSKNTAGEPKPPGHPQLDSVVENYVNRAGPLKGRSLYILKREAPTESSATHTRSGRVSVRPLAYWRNERCVYGDGEAAEGQRYPLSTIKEVIRTEEPELERRKANNRRSSKKPKSKKQNHEDASDSDDYIDPWEKNEGVLHGYVRKWDPEVQTGTEDEEVVGMPSTFTTAKSETCVLIQLDRYRLCPFWNRDPRCQRLKVSVCETSEFSFPGIWDRRAASRGSEETEEFEENAHGVLRLPWPSADRYIRCTIQCRQRLRLSSSTR